METPLSYVFDNDHPEAADRHGQLPTILDEFTIARLSSLGDLTGLRCLETGAGAAASPTGSPAATGPAGRVLATDVNTRHLPPSPPCNDVPVHDLEKDPRSTGTRPPGT
ncbi:hypothetical protein ACRAWF_15625 [Streptomyces sp. L7]